MERLSWQVRAGRWLFRHRSHMPVLFAVLFLPAVESFKLNQHSSLQQLKWELVCLGISLLGLAVRVMTVAYVSEASSGRELSAPKAEQLNTTGSYSLVRNPLYVGNSIIWLGVSSMMQLWWLSLSILLISLLYYRLIICAEEYYLGVRFGQSYVKWAKKTPTFIPSIRYWAPPELPFSMAMVIRREYSGFFQIIATFAFMNAMLNYAAQGVLAVHFVFQYLLIAASVICGAIWVIVKRTSWLPAPDRSNIKTSTTASEQN
ncbi:MAG TPA: methyltransferase [Negativicutes bacterium]|nr:methyltransferase [Negativicutes bacterium]